MVKDEVKKDDTGLGKLKLYGNAKKVSNEYPDDFRLLYSPTTH
jgi:hypothetical protein